MDISENTPPKPTSVGRKIILEPLSDEEIERRFTGAAGKIEKRYGRALKRLAQ